MTDGYVTGLVSVEDGNPPATGSEFDPRRKVRVEIGYAHDVNADPQSFVDRAAAMANAKVAELLGRDVPKNAPAQPEEKPARAARSKKAEAAQPVSSAPSADTAGSEASDPFLPEAPESPEVAALREQLIHEADPFVAEEDAANEDDDPFTVQPAAVEITDAALNKAVQDKNKEINNTPAIRALIATFNPDPTRVFQLREIAPAQRQDFLDKLAGLKKAA